MSCIDGKVWNLNLLIYRLKKKAIVLRGVMHFILLKEEKKKSQDKTLENFCFGGSQNQTFSSLVLFWFEITDI